MLLMASCACTREDESLPQQGTISFPETEVTVPSEGGPAGITYTYEDLDPDAELEFESSDSWVHSFSTGGANTINFTVDANDSGEPRTAIVDVSVKGMAGSSSFAVLQDYVAPPDLQIIIDEIGMNSVKGHTVAADPELRYTVLMLSEANYNSLDRDGQRVFDTFLSDCEIIASYNGISIEEYLEQILVSGEYPFEYKDLHASSSYVLVAVGLDTDGTRTTDVFTEIFTTENFTNNNIDFTFETAPANGNGVDTDITAFASDDTTRFTMNVFKKSDVESSGMTVEQHIQTMLDTYIGRGMMVGHSLGEVVDMNSYYGKNTLKMHDILEDETEYIAAACAITSDGKVNSSAGTFEFTTGSLLPSDNQLSLNIEEVGLDKVIFSVKTTNDDKYHIFLDDKAENYSGMTGDEILSRITTSFHIVSEYTGDRAHIVRSGLTPGASYLIAVFGYHNGAKKPTTDIVYDTFTLSSEIGNPEELAFDIQINDITASSVKWSIDATPVTCLYYSGIYPADWTEDDIKNTLTESALYWISSGRHIETVADYFRWVGYRGHQDLSDETLYSETEYRIIAVGIYDNNGDYATDMVFSNIITTDARVVSDAKVTIQYDKYFDGEELAALYPELAQAAGNAVLPLTAVTEGDAANIYYYGYIGNYMDTETYSDDYVISDLISYGPAMEYGLFSAPYDADITIMAVAEDSDGNYGPVFRKQIVLTRDGTAPADEFVIPEYSPSFTYHSVSPLRCPDNNQSNN